MSSHLYLVKESDELVCHCDCDPAYVTFPGQMDCPWCGCGWLFTCIDCRKAFAFARAIEVSESWEEIGRRDLSNSVPNATVDDDELGEWVAAMQELMADLEEGEEYVYFDGLYIPSECAGAEFEGWYARHNLSFLPHVSALEHESSMKSILANPRYWNENKIDEDDDDE